MEISWTDHVRSEEILHTVKEEKNILHRVKYKANWIGHSLHWNGIIERAIERKIEKSVDVTERRGRRCRQILNDLKLKRGCYKLKYEVLARALWRVG
jgi:replicative superfamily II helicase